MVDASEAPMQAVAANKNENLDAELAMRDACDRHGQFKRIEKDGVESSILEFPHYLALRSIIVR